MVANLLVILVVSLLILMPGLALLHLTGAWRTWRTLQRISIAIGIGLSVYPILLYWLRLLLPNLHLQPWMGWGGLLVSSIVAIPELRKWRFPITRIDVWLIAGIALLTFVSRIWIVWDRPFPAWTDSLHHTLLTQLTVEQGQLPTSMQPYFDIPLAMYHLGLYSLSGLVAQMLTLPAHTALLWTAQTLNALCIVGVFLILDRYVGRAAAVTGILVVGLLDHQPAFYVNWGRFTQLSSQTLLLIAWVMSIDTIENWYQLYPSQRNRLIAQVFFAGIASAAVFLYHFRGSIFYLALLAPGILSVMWQAFRRERLLGALTTSVLIGAVAMTAILPVVWPAIQTWLQLNQAAAESPVAPSEKLQQNESGFFTFEWTHVPLLAARTWLLALATVSIAVGIVRRNRIVWLSLIWVLVLVLIGNMYLLGVPELNLTNMGAILIMLYMPIALSIGAAAQEVVRLLSQQWVATHQRIFALAVLLSALPFVWIRAHDVEAFRYFVTPADVSALGWLAANSPPGAQVAINTTFWLPTSPHGTDAGYWIPYFTQQKTNTGVMISSLGGVDVVRKIMMDSTVVKQAENDPATLARLHDLGYTYLYLGVLGNFDGGGFQPQTVESSGLADKVYQADGVTIFALHGE